MAADCCPLPSAAALAGKTRNVVLIVSDGLRWQEIFTGAEADLLNEKAGGSWVSEEDLRKRYWRDDARRAPCGAVSRSSGAPSPSEGKSSATAPRAAMRTSPTARRSPIRATTR